MAGQIGTFQNGAFQIGNLVVGKALVNGTPVRQHRTAPTCLSRLFRLLLAQVQTDDANDELLIFAQLLSEKVLERLFLCIADVFDVQAQVFHALIIPSIAWMRKETGRRESSAGQSAETTEATARHCPCTAFRSGWFELPLGRRSRLAPLGSPLGDKAASTAVSLSL